MNIVEQIENLIPQIVTKKPLPMEEIFKAVKIRLRLLKYTWDEDDDLWHQVYAIVNDLVVSKTGIVRIRTFGLKREYLLKETYDKIFI